MKELSPEQVKEEFAKIEAQRKEMQRLSQKAAHYNTVIDKGALDLDIMWITDLEKIDLNGLQTELVSELIQRFPADFSIETLKLDEVLAENCDDLDTHYPKNDLWAERSEHTIARLLEFIEQSNALIPPMIRKADGKFAVIDGHHRIALCRFWGLQEIPFLVDQREFKF